MSKIPRPLYRLPPHLQGSQTRLLPMGREYAHHLRSGGGEAWEVHYDEPPSRMESTIRGERVELLIVK